ncbi:MAG TPA: type II secretion system F family protein [Armatimonadota bacterium]|nr:type II secretion system F family protein [Armatimonadota bacterium]
MPTFAYVVKDKTGKESKGSLDGESRELVVKQLRDQGYVVSQVQEQAQAKVKKSGGFRLRRKVGLKDLSIFCRQFATMINAGVSLVRCLDVLEQQTNSVNLKEIVREIQTEVEGGATLSRSMAQYPRVFSNLAIGLVRAGEVGGVLDETLDRLAGFLESDMALRRKIKAAMTYPVLVMFVAVGIVTFLVTFILPKFIALFEELGVEEFPTPTLILMRISNFATSKWWLCVIIIVCLVIGINRLKATKTGRRYFDIIKLKVPVFGSLNHKIAVARFARTLSTLLSSGVPILQAMETVAGTVDNTVIAEAIMLSRTAIREGETIGDPLAQSRMFPPMVVQMITIGEETGQLDSMLAKVADFYEAEVEAALESLTAALEPIMIVVLGFVVGFIVISMFMPLISIIGSLSS